MTIEREQLVQAALDAGQRAYAPYSQFRVGAALLISDGRTFVGCNVENASYGLTICAERSALFSAVAAGAREFVAIAVYTPTSKPTPPCGACRQVLWEFAPEIRVFLACQSGEVVEHRLADLLPCAFSGIPTV